MGAKSPFLNANEKLCRILTKVSRLALVVFALLLVSLPAFPQANQGTIQGSVFDQTGGAIVGATVAVIDVARGVTRTLTTDSAGAYVAPNLIPGTYTVNGTATGFQKLERTNILLGVGQTVRVDLVLQPGQQTQTVTVTSEAPTVDTSDATVGSTLTQATLQDIPMNGRNFRNAMTLTRALLCPLAVREHFPACPRTEPGTKI